MLLDPAVLEKVVRSRGGGVGEADQRPDRVFLNLENVHRGTSDAGRVPECSSVHPTTGAWRQLSVDWVVPFGVEEAD